MELKRRKQAQIEQICQETEPTGQAPRLRQAPTAIPLVQNSSLIRVLRPGTIGQNLGYRKVLQFDDDQYKKQEKDTHDQIIRYYKDYEERDEMSEEEE